MAGLHDELEKKLQDSNATPMSLPLQFLKAITCDFSTEYELGRGGYGVVYKGVLQSGKIIAVKKLFEIQLVDDKTFQNEVGYLMDIKHQHVVQFIGYCAESSWELIKQPSGNFIWAEIPRRLLCFEYLCNKSLEKYISVPSDNSSVLDWNMRYEIMRGIFKGLNFLHEECHIVHLDLKPENILMDDAMTPKIADFGLSRIFGNQQSRIFTSNSIGSRGYMAPEYMIRGIISMKADIFSLGVIMIEIITGCRDYPYFQLDNPHSTATSCQHFIENVLGSWKKILESTSKYIPREKYNLIQLKECITIALKCVDPDMEKRPTTKDIIQVLNEVDQMEANKQMPSEMHALNLDTNSRECLSPSTSSHYHQEAAKESSEPRQAIVETSEIIRGSSILLHVHPVELRFHFEPNKLISCSLDLSNNTDKNVVFGLLEKTDDQTYLIRSLPMFGTVDPGTTYTIVLTMNTDKITSRERNVDLILQTSTYFQFLGDKEACKQHFLNVEQLGNIVHRVTLKAVCSLQGETIIESIPPSVKMISVGDDRLSHVTAMDANQTEPLIITGSYMSPINIWNSDTQKHMGSFCIPNGASVRTVKFITRKGWFLAGMSDAFIHVYNYKEDMQMITSINAGSYFSSTDSLSHPLAIHPTQSYVLSACITRIKLWDWDHHWKCIQTFKEPSGVSALAFNPEDKSFASASLDRTIKVWSIDSPKSMYTLFGHSRPVICLDFFMRDGRQYLITGSVDKTSKIWDMKKKECVLTLHQREVVVSVLPHPKFPVLVTFTSDGHVYLWSSINFRLKRILDINICFEFHGLQCLMDSLRFAVRHRYGLLVIDISDEEAQGDSSCNGGDSLSAAD